MPLRFLLALTLLIPTLSHAELIDKIVGVFEDKIFSLNEIKRVQDNLKARNNISPQLFNSTDLSHKEITSILISSEIIRKKLEEIGYIIADEQVESQIRSTEKRLQLSRDQLVQFIENNGLKFTEYFEIIRQTIQYNIFLQRIISPLISVTDQEVVAEFKKKFPNKTAQSFVYNLIDFTLPGYKANKKNNKKLSNSINQFVKFNNKDEFIKKASIANLDEIEEDGLNAEMKSAISGSTADSMSKPVVLGGVTHVFYVKNKTVTYSEFFKSKKNLLKNMIAQKEIGNVVKVWLDREGKKYFQKIFI